MIRVQPTLPPSPLRYVVNEIFCYRLYNLSHHIDHYLFVLLVLQRKRNALHLQPQQYRRLQKRQKGG